MSSTLLEPLWAFFQMYCSLWKLVCTSCSLILCRLHSHLCPPTDYCACVVLSVAQFHVPRPDFSWESCAHNCFSIWLGVPSGKCLWVIYLPVFLSFIQSSTQKNAYQAPKGQALTTQCWMRLVGSPQREAIKLQTKGSKEQWPGSCFEEQGPAIANSQGEPLWKTTRI